MKGQFNTINTGGTAISAALLVSTQFSAVRTLFSRAISRVINVDEQQEIGKVQSCSITVPPKAPEEAFAIESQQEYNLEEENPTETQLQMKAIDVDTLKQNDLEFSHETSCMTQNEIYVAKLDPPITSENTDVTEKSAQTQSTSQETSETQLAKGTHHETPKKHRKTKTHKTHTTETPRKPTENVQPKPKVNAGQQEFKSLMKIAEANAKTEYILMEEGQNTGKAIRAPKEPAPSASNGCPKNLAYYNQTPKPKETPNECFSCSKLIACVCRTSS